MQNYITTILTVDLHQRPNITQILSMLNILVEESKVEPLFKISTNVEANIYNDEPTLPLPKCLASQPIEQITPNKYIGAPLEELRNYYENF